MLARSDNGGTSFNPRFAVDTAARPPEPAGLGFAQPSVRPSFPQAFPALSSGGGQLLLAYFEARSLNGDSGLDATNHYIAGYNRVLDFRGASLSPSTGSLLKTFQISRYPIKPWAADPVTSNTVDDLEPINPPCLPDFPDATVNCVRRINRAAPQSAASSSGFERLQRVPLNFIAKTDGQVGGNGRHCRRTFRRSVRYRYSQQRSLNPPTTRPAWNRPTISSTPSAISYCTDLGRNTDVFAARVNLGLAWPRRSPGARPLRVPAHCLEQHQLLALFNADLTNGVTVGSAKKPACQRDPFNNLPRGCRSDSCILSNSRVVYVAESNSPLVTVR
jgi:hypothetical protein